MAFLNINHKILFIIEQINLNKIKMRTTIVWILFLLFVACSSQKKTTQETEIIYTTPEIINTYLEIELEKGKYHNHPSFAVWIEDLDGNYIETLYVTQYFAKGVYGHGESEPGKWRNEPGEARRPAALPYWSHKRNIKAPGGLYAPSPETAVPDALTGATPKGNVILKTGSKIKAGEKYKVYFEVNQPWDSNDFWTNNKFPDDFNYKTSLQPAIVYSAEVESGKTASEVALKAVGHSEPSGKNGQLFTDLSTFTTAKEIFEKIIVRIK